MEAGIMAVTVKSQDEINRMRDAGKILAEVHEKLEEIISNFLPVFVFYLMNFSRFFYNY